MSATSDLIQKIYIGYFGRAGDPSGLNYWVEQSAAGLSDAAIAQSFSVQPEATDMYGFLAAPSLNMGRVEFLNSVYQNLFGRDMDAEGEEYWIGQLDAGRPVGGIILDIINGAQNSDEGQDLTIITNKLAVANYYTENVMNSSAVWTVADDQADAIAVLLGVGASDASVVAAQALAASLIAADVALPQQNLALTAAPDFLEVTGIAPARVTGVVDGADSTLNAGDTILGNDNTTLRVIVQGVEALGGSIEVADVNVVEFIGEDNSGAAQEVNALNWDVGAVRVVDSVSGFELELDNLSADTDLEIVAEDGWNEIIAAFTNDVWGWFYAERGETSYVDGNVYGSGSEDNSFSMWNDDASEIAVGDVTFNGDGATWSYVGIYQDENEGEDVTIGDVVQDGYDWVGMYVYNTSHTTTDSAWNITVGNVSQAAANEMTLSISNTGWSGEAGNLTVGDIHMSLAADATNNMQLFLNNAGLTAAGDMTVGDVTLDVGDHATNGFARIYSSVWASPTNAPEAGGAIGELVIGDFTLNVGQSADFYVDIYRGFGEDSEDASVGEVSLGDVAVNVGINASATYTFYAEYSFTNVTGDTVALGDITLGDFTVNVAEGGDFYGYQLDYNVDADSSDDVVSGNVSIGDLVVNLGASATATVYAEVSASADLPSFIRGNVTATVGESAYLWISDSIEMTTSDADLGLYQVGNISLTANGVSAYAGFESSLSVDYTSSDLDQIVIGNVALAATAKSATAEYFLNASVASGDLGTTSIGNVTISAAAESALAYMGVSLSAESGGDVDDTSVGNVSVTANGKNSTAEFYMSVSASSGDIGDLAMGNVSLAATGEGANALFTVDSYASNEAGDWTFGNITATATGTAKKAGTNVDAYITNTDGDEGTVTVGNITVSGNARGSTDSSMTWDIDVSIAAEGDVNVGNITVSGGYASSSVADPLADINDWLHLTSDNGDITIGNVDYSGYSTTLSTGTIIDLSAWQGAAIIKGSANKDTITDTMDTNRITGGAGVDKFVFINTNDGLTLSSMDKIVDFSNSAGETIDVGVAGTTGNYNEGTFATFAAFLSAANSDDKDLYVGYVSGAGGAIVAVDFDSDDIVDFMVQLEGVTLSGIDHLAFV